MRSEFANEAAMMKWLAEHGEGRSLHVSVLHDEACLRGPNHACTCRPAFVVEELTVDSYMRGQTAQRQWFGRHRRN
jgi:hypothetical protein